MMTKKLLKKSLLLFLSGIIIVSCTLEKDALEEHEHKELTKQRISLYEIPGLQSKINARIQTNKSMNRGEEIDYLELINPDNVLLIEEENGNKHYTFSLNMQESNTLTNVIIKQVGTEIDYKVIEYASPDIEQWLIDNIDNGYSNIEPTITEKGGNPNSSAFCPRFHYSCPGIGHSLSDIAGGANCPYEFSDFIVTITYEACGGAGGGAGNFDHFGDDNSNNNTGSPSDNNYGSGGNNNNTTFTNPNPPCDPRVDCPLLTGESITPCESLNKLSLSADQNINPALITLKSKLQAGATKEWGVKFKNDTDAVPAALSNEVVEGGPNSVPFTKGFHYRGGAHIHTKEGIGMLSWGDVYLLEGCYDFASPTNKPYVTNIMMCNNPQPGDANHPGLYNTYAIKVDDYSLLSTYINGVWNDPKYTVTPSGNDQEDFQEKMEDIINDKDKSNIDANGDPTALEKLFINKFSNNGVSLYKKNDVTGKWEKLTIDPVTNSITATPCD